MSIPTHINDLESEKFIESTAVAGQTAIAVSNPDGSNIGSSITVTSDTEFPAAAALADGTANPTTTTVGAMNEVFNGTTWDRVRSGQTSNSTTITGFQNNLPMARYNASPTARTEGQFGNFQASANGGIKVSLEDLISGEDQTAGLLGVFKKILATSTYSYSVDVSSALEASTVSKNSSGNLFRVFGVIDKSAATGLYYVQILNSNALPADGSVTHLVTPLVINHTTGTNSSFDTLNDFESGVYASNGIIVCVSTTMVTKTISGSILFATALYK